VSNPAHDSAHFMRKYILQLLWFCVPPLAIMFLSDLALKHAIKNSYVNLENGMLISYIIELVILPYLSAGMLILVASLSDGKSIGSKEILNRVSPMWFYYLVLFIVMYFFIFSGLLLFLIPGIWLYIRLIFAQPIMVFEGKVPMDALISSYQRTAKKMSLLVPLLMPVVIMIFGAYAFILYAAGFRGGENVTVHTLHISTGLSVFIYLVNLVIFLYTSTLQFRLYQLFGNGNQQ